MFPSDKLSGSYSLLVVTIFFISQYCLILSAAPAAYTLQGVQKMAAVEGWILEPLVLPKNADAIIALADEVIAEANASGDEIEALSIQALTIDNTIRALDRIAHNLDRKAAPIWLLEETSPELSIREAGTEAVKKLDAWQIDFGFRVGIYLKIKAFAETDEGKSLTGEAAKFLRETIRDYKRNGLALPKKKRDQLQKLKTELAILQTDYRETIRKADAKVSYTREELKGMPESFFEIGGVANDDGTFTVDVSTTYLYIMLAENVEIGPSRKRAYMARYNRAREENIPRLREVVLLRKEICEMLGYDSWADYRTETRMAGSERVVRNLLNELALGLGGQLYKELNILTELKREHTGDSDAELMDWDNRYYSNMLKKERYDIDREALRRFFPYKETLHGMFGIYEHLFGIKIAPVTGMEVWHESVTTHVIIDNETGLPLGLFGLDMFPREGKYKHFASFPLMSARLLEDGRYHRPLNVLVCNFPMPTAKKPSLLAYDEVETLFHEFGHLLHSIMSQSEYSAFSGTSVPRDFVEAPSQMLEFWLESKAVLDRFAADYEDPDKKLPASVIDNLIAAKKATIASHYRRQIALGMMDFNLHTKFDDADAIDPLKITQSAWNTYYRPSSTDTAFAASFGHLMGYDAGYYGYIWSEVIAADMATVFENAPDGFLDANAGRRLRKEIYERGDTRLINDSIEAFLGRPFNQEAFLRRLGLE